MSTDPRASEVSGHADAVGHHSTDDHGDDHGHDDHGHDDHAHGQELLGPIDLRAWGAALLGVVLGIVTAAGFVIATTTNAAPV